MAVIGEIFYLFPPGHPDELAGKTLIIIIIITLLIRYHTLFIIERIIIIFIHYNTHKMTTKINQLTQNNSSRKDGPIATDLNRERLSRP